MSSLTTQDLEKVDEYMHIIQTRILAPIRETEIRQSCTATLLLLFSAIDGLGKLLHPSKKARCVKRISEFLDYMGGGYADHKTELLALRHSLVHNAINVESYLSRAEPGSEHHLKEIGAAKFIYVNTVVMYRDFVEAFNRFHRDIQNNPDLLKQAADRLEWRESNPSDNLDPDMPAPTPPPPIEFICAKD